MNRSFDKSNLFGKHCVWALVPGWGHVTGVDGHMQSVGQRMDFAPKLVGTADGSEQAIKALSYSQYGATRVWIGRPISDTEGSHFIRADPTGDAGILFPDIRNLSIIAIFRPEGDGSIGTADPRIFNQVVTGSVSSANHDLMVGFDDANQLRSRVKLEGLSTITVLSGGTIVSDAMHLVAAHVFPLANGTQVQAGCTSLDETGNFDQTFTAAQTSAGYEPRTTGMSINIGGSYASTVAAAVSGEIIGIWAFSHHMNERYLLEKFFKNPWQVFKPSEVIVPINESLPDVGIIEKPW